MRMLASDFTDHLSAWSAAASACFGTLALVVAALAARFAWRANQTQSLQLAELKNKDEQALASQFAMWIELTHRLTTPSKWVRCFAVVYINRSGFPVFDIEIKHSESPRPVKLDQLNPTNQPKLEEDTTEILLSLINEAHRHTSKEKQDTIALRPDPSEGPLLPHDQDQIYAFQPIPKELEKGLEVTFTDAAGCSWIRRTNGTLDRAARAARG